MKTRMLCALLSVLLLLSLLSGCGGTGAEGDAAGNSSESDSYVSDVSSDDILLSVLNNKQVFVTENNDTTFLKDYKLGDQQNVPVEVEKYALVDMDNDGIKELVVYVSANYGAYIVFRYGAAVIRGYVFEERAFIDLKSDGSFIQSQGAGINCYSRLRFDNNQYTTIHDAVSNDEQQEYELDGTVASAEDMNVYIQNRNAKPNVEWIVTDL